MIRLAVRCTPDQAELVLAELTVLAPGGVEEIAGDEYVEYAIYGAEGELPDLGEIKAVTGRGLVEVATSEVADDWADRWRSFHKPLLVGDPSAGPAIRIRPPWEPAEAEVLEIVVDPGRAFGTGAHPTTRLCIGELIRLSTRGGANGDLTDLGCGSGVLAIAASRLGWDSLHGYDHETAAIDAARENAQRNEVVAEFDRHDLREGLPPLAPVTVANLTAGLLELVAGQLKEDNLPETLICSGLLTTEYDRVKAAFEVQGMSESGRGESGDWGSLTLTSGTR